MGPFKIKALLFAEGGGRERANSLKILKYVPVTACGWCPRHSALSSGYLRALHPGQKDPGRAQSGHKLEEGIATTYRTWTMCQTPCWDLADMISFESHSPFIQEISNRQLAGIIVGKRDTEGLLTWLKQQSLSSLPSVHYVWEGTQTIIKHVNKS